MRFDNRGYRPSQPGARTGGHPTSVIRTRRRRTGATHPALAQRGRRLKAGPPRKSGPACIRPLPWRSRSSATTRWRPFLWGCSPTSCGRNILLRTHGIGIDRRGGKLCVPQPALHQIEGMPAETATNLIGIGGKEESLLWQQFRMQTCKTPARRTMQNNGQFSRLFAEIRTTEQVETLPSTTHGRILVPWQYDEAEQIRYDCNVPFCRAFKNSGP